MSSDTMPTPTSTTTTASLTAGVLGGVIGGGVFGVMMQTMGMMPMVAMLVGSESVAIGWVVHLAISAAFGAGYALFAGSRPLPLQMAMGAVYGVVLWVVGALVLMPARLGMDLFMINTMTLRSLLGHIIFGLLLGAVVSVLPRRESR